MELKPSHMECKPSYSATPSKRPYVYMTYGELIRYWAAKHPDNEAFVEYSRAGGKSALTCKELSDQASHFGKYLVSIGVRKGDLVLVCMGNSLNLLIAVFGIAFAGGVCVNYLPMTENGSDVIDLAKIHSCVVMITDVSYGNISTVKNYIMHQEDMNVLKIICNVIQEDYVTDIKPEVAILSEILQSETPASNDLDLARVCADDIACYFQSSGSTGPPKLIGHSHFSYFNSTFGINDVMQIDQSSKFYCDRPLTWGVGSPRTFLASGVTRVFTDTRWAMQKGSIDDIAELIGKEGCTHVYLPAYQLVNLLARPELAEKFTTVKCIKFAGERFKKHYTDLVRLGFCKRLVVWYGSTEAAGVSAFVSDDLDLYEDGIIGKPLEGVEMKIINEHGTTVGEGESGELVIRSVYRFLEYKGGSPGLFGNVVDSSGCLRTGDTAHVRADGNFIMDGRFSEVVSRGTNKFFPWMVEEFICSIPGVISAVGVPLPDKRLNNVLCACVIIDVTSGLDIEDIRKRCEARFVAETVDGTTYRPEYYIIMDRFPTLGTGKLDRKALAQKALELLGLNK